MTNENKNELKNVEETTQTELVQQNDLNGEIIEETDEYVVRKIDGKYKRFAKYNEYSSIVAETKAQKIWLMNLMDGDEETGNGLKSFVGKEIEVANIITRPYDKINEETGVKEFGVLTYLIDPSDVPYVTSSKTVYFSINRLMKLIGKPTDSDWENIKIKVGSRKGQNGDMITIKMVG